MKEAIKDAISLIAFIAVLAYIYFVGAAVGL